ncbi:ABC transporter substrate-binding protein [Streptomyces sp. URMC 123]|uniref:ABC transporter substrate-binding protein n=1 Tax=Streptomyces sp. URMC 123 TaxID=3423403 RepID=UPI003F1B0AE8
MRKRHQWLAVPVGAGLAAGLLTGCGSDDADAAGKGDPLVMGMTDKIVSTDPASGYDPASWMIFNNVFQSLMSFPRGGTVPEPEAAERCGFQDAESKTYKCVLKDGLKFSNGHELTSKDVAHSFNRTLKINDKAGPAVMLSIIKSIETPDEKTVVFRLKNSDATFPMKIASGAGSIVDHREYAADKLRTDNKAVGSGVYKLDKYSKDQAVLTLNTGYKGPAKARNSGMTMKFFNDQGALKTAVQDGAVDLAYRGLAMKDIADLEAATTTDKRGVEVVEGTSAEIQHLVFNMKDPVVGKPGVRKAIAYLIDRSALVRDVYKRTAKPLYSVVPAGITGHNTAFFDTYGDRPQKEKAAAALRSAGYESGKVPLTLWATPVRYGPATVAAFEEIAQQLNASGLFDAKVKSVPFEEYEKGMEAGRYGIYAKGWVPDYPDPDNFTAPFFGKDSVLSNNYESDRISKQLLPSTAAEDNRTATAASFVEVQNIVAQELPVIPLWQGKQYAVARNNVSGLEWSLDASTVFRFWEISKGGQG